MTGASSVVTKWFTDRKDAVSTAAPVSTLGVMGVFRRKHSFVVFGVGSNQLFYVC